MKPTNFCYFFKKITNKRECLKNVLKQYVIDIFLCKICELGFLSFNLVLLIMVLVLILGLEINFIVINKQLRSTVPIAHRCILRQNCTRYGFKHYSCATGCRVFESTIRIQTSPIIYFLFFINRKTFTKCELPQL